MARAQSGWRLVTCLVMALVTLAGAAVAATIYGGWILGGLLLGIVAAIGAAPAERRFRRGMAIVAALLLTAPCLLPAVSACREAAVRSVCWNNLRRIGAALRSYHDRYGELPPPYLADEEGRPMHSWRVLILPFLGENALHRRYDRSEPWDGPNNRLLGDAMPKVYRCPGDPSSDERPEECTTSYAALLGPDTVWAEGNRNLDALEMPSATLLLVETVETGIHWMEPRDVAVEEHTIPAPVQPPLLTAVLWGAPPPHPPPHPGGRNVLFADGAVRFFPFPLTPESLATLASVEADPKIFVEPLYPQPQEPTALERYLPGIRISGFLVTVLGAIGFGIALARARFRGEGGG